MKKTTSFLILIFSVANLFAATLPELGNGRILVLANNLENYYYNYAESARPDYNTEAGLAEKTHKIADMMLAADADIYAFCEVEAKPIVLQQLVDTLNKMAEAELYATVSDGIYEATDEYDNALKSGFIYRKDKVQPYGSSHPASTWTYYKNTMRIQVFEEISTGERFTLSMNHFKAKSTDSDKQQRINNANHLLNALPQYATDPDILIMGDLNAQIDEECIALIQNAGYEEQLLRFDSTAYSYCWNYSGELIDHVFANASMAKQITGAGVWHLNNLSCNCYRCYDYSDHDPYLVALDLGKRQEQGGEDDKDDCQNFQYTETFASSLGSWEVVNVKGESNWFWYSNYSCAYMNAYQTLPDEDWLVSPVFDFRGQKHGSVSFTHALGYGNNPQEWPQQCMLFVSDDYDGDVQTAAWTQLDITNWGSSNWEWKDNTIAIPDEFMGKEDVRLAFKYDAQTSAPAWEIKNLTVSAQCDNTCNSGEDGAENNSTGNDDEEELQEDGVDDILRAADTHSGTLILQNGSLYLLKDGITYTILGLPAK